MARTVNITQTEDFNLAELHIVVTSAGYRTMIRGQEVTAVNGQPVASAGKEYNNDTGGHDPTALFNEVTAIVAAIKARDYA